MLLGKGEFGRRGGRFERRDDGRIRRMENLGSLCARNIQVGLECMYVGLL